LGVLTIPELPIVDNFQLTPLPSRQTRESGEQTADDLLTNGEPGRGANAAGD
jgi:hypothetical protein